MRCRPSKCRPGMPAQIGNAFIQQPHINDKSFFLSPIGTPLPHCINLTRHKKDDTIYPSTRTCNASKKQST